MSWLQFFREVRQEGAKVTWPSRKETVVTTGMVVIMVMIVAIFLLIVDQILAFGVQFFLSVGA